MRILNLSYQSVPNLPEHEMLHRSINDLGTTGWTGLIEEARVFKPDLIIEREWNDSKALYDPLYAAFPNVPKAWWWIDAHVLYEYRKPYARNFDYLFMAISRYVDPANKEVGVPAFWLPLSCPWEAGSCIPPPPEKDLDIVFIARVQPTQYFPRRLKAIKIMEGRFQNRYHFETTPNMAQIVRRAKVGMNCAYAFDLNFRVFETLGLGTELLTDDVPDLWNIPGLEDRITVYSNFEELPELAQDLLDGKGTHDMAEVQEWVRQNHCIEHRYRQLIKELQNEKAVPD